MTIAARIARPYGRIQPMKARFVEDVFYSPEFRAGAKRGYDDYLAGQVRPWAEVKKELGL